MVLPLQEYVDYRDRGGKEGEVLLGSNEEGHKEG